FRLERRHPMSDMDDLHEEEYQAEVQTYILWCEGRLEELRREGLVVGQSALTESGWSKYGKLVASGFVPSKEKVMWTLESDPHVPRELVTRLVALMLGQQEGGSK